MRYAAAILALSLVVVGVVGVEATAPAWGQTALRPRSRPVAAPPPPAVVAAAPVPSRAPGRLTLNGLPSRTDAAPACRARCTQTRLACEAVAETCVPAWTACLQRCRGGA